jgi:Putative restriction endonuclease
MATMAATIHGNWPRQPLGPRADGTGSVGVELSADSATGGEPVDCNSLTSEDTRDRLAGNSSRCHWHSNRSHEDYNERMPDHSRSSGDDDLADAGSSVKLTHDDFLLFPDDGKRHELRERAAQVLTRLHAKGVPELVVEIGSPATRKRDETIKRRLYERAGVTSTGSSILILT